MLLVEGFQKFAGIPFGISRIFEGLMPQQISATRRKNHSIQVKVLVYQFYLHFATPQRGQNPPPVFSHKDTQRITKKRSSKKLGTVRDNDPKFWYNRYMRRERITYAGAYHHVMNRGYDGNYIFAGISLPAFCLDSMFTG